MAKIKSIIEISGTIGELTFVNSSAYPPHVRRKRGTFTPIVLNDGMKESALNQTLANQKAQLIYTPLKAFTNGFNEGKLWSKLIKKFRKQQKDKLHYTFAPFNRTELRSNYPSSSHAYFELSGNQQHTAVCLQFRGKPKLQLATYELQLLRISADQDLNMAYPVQIATIQTNLNAATGSINFNFEPLPIDAQVIYCLKCERLENGKSNGTLATKGMVLLTA